MPQENLTVRPQERTWGRAALAPETWNQEARTVDVVWTTGADVQRMDWWTGARWVERLDLGAGAVDLARMNGGAPVLNTHGSYELDDIIGVVVDGSARIEGGVGVATIRLSDRESVAGIVGDVASGIIRNLSVGYVVDKWEIQEATAASAEIRTAKRWVPYEISLVPIPADAGAQVRGEPAGVVERAVRAALATLSPIPQSPAAPPAMQETRMPSDTPLQDNPQPTPTRAAPNDAIATQVLAAERKRTTDIFAIAELAGLPADWARTHVESDVSPDAVRDLALAEVKKRATTRVHPAAMVIRDEGETRAAMMENAMLHRAQAPGIKLEDGAREFRGFQLVDFARHCLEANGLNTRGMSRSEIARSALLRNYHRNGTPGMSSSDFPNLLANTASKMLRDSYTYAPRTFLPWSTQHNLPDFKTFRTVALSGAPQLAAVPESGEVSYGTIGEGAESWGLTRFGKATAITYVAIVNDDMSGFTRIPRMFGAEAAQLENATVYGLLTANAAMADTGLLFNATAVTTAGGHANLTSGGTSALTNDAAGLAAVGALQKLIRLQKAPTVGGVAGRPLNLTGRFLVIPAALEYVANALFSQSVVPATTGAANPYRGQFEIIIEPILDGSSSISYYLIAEPARVDTIHYGYLDGEAGPMVGSNVDFETDGVSIKCMHNFGAKAIDFRGLAKSAGQ